MFGVVTHGQHLRANANQTLSRIRQPGNPGIPSLKGQACKGVAWPGRAALTAFTRAEARAAASVDTCSERIFRRRRSALRVNRSAVLIATWLALEKQLSATSFS